MANKYPDGVNPYPEKAQAINYWELIYLLPILEHA